MPYTDTPPTALELANALAGDLRDPSGKTFAVSDLARFLNDGIVEVNRIYPLEVTDSITCVQEQTDYPTRFTSIYRVEVWDDATILAILPFNDGDNSYAGWELHGLTLAIPPSVVEEAMLTQYTSLTLKVTGYARRQKIDPIGSPSVATELDSEAETACRWFAAYRGFMSLMSDRSLYGQWQSQSNNTDVSMTQLMTLVTTASQQWERHKAGLKTLRRQPVGGAVVI